MTLKCKNQQQLHYEKKTTTSPQIAFTVTVKKKFKSNAQNSHNSKATNRQADIIDGRWYQCKVKIKYKTYYCVCIFVRIIIHIHY